MQASAFQRQAGMHERGPGRGRQCNTEFINICPRIIYTVTQWKRRACGYHRDMKGLGDAARTKRKMVTL